MKKSSSLLLVSLILGTLVLGTLGALFATPPFPSSPTSIGQHPQTSFAPPSSQPGNGYPMNLSESVNGFKPWGLNTTNKFSGNLVTPNNDSFSIQVPTNYVEIWQYISIENIVAGTGYRAVQDGFGTTGLKCGSQGIPSSEYHMLAINFTIPDRVNLTSVWLRYGAFQDIGAVDPPVIPLNIETDSATHVPSGTILGNGSLQNTISAGWHEVQVRTSDGKPVTLQPATAYWIVMNGSSIPGGNDGYYVWYYVSDSGGSYDNKSVAVYPTSSWVLEPTLFSPINLLSVLFVKAVDVSLATKVYSSPADVQMMLNGTLISGDTVSVNPSKTLFKFTTNCSVTFTANWTARFEYSQPNAVSTHYIAESGFTLWNASFLVASKPTNPYTWYNLTFKVRQIPSNWSRTSPPTNITNTPHAYPSLFAAGSDYYLITQTDANNTFWDNNWLIMAKSTYRVSASLPAQVVDGLPLTLNVTTKPHSPSWCNVSFYNPLGDHVYSRNVSIPLFSTLVTLKLNETGVHTLFLFDRWTGGNEASLNETLTINVLPADCNVTVTGRTSPVIGNVGALKFKFFNTTLGNVVIQPLAVSVNGTLTTNFAYDGASGNTTVYMNTASVGWRTGNNTVRISAKSGVYNATRQTWILVQRPLCNVTVVSVNQPFLGGTASLSFKFFNKTLGAAPVLIDPASVKINGTSTSFTYSSGVVTTTWNTATGGWHVGLNHVNVSATLGIFSNYTVAVLTIIKPLCNVTVTSVDSPILGNPATAQFRFLNGTNGWAPVSPISVRINGTDMPLFTYLGGVTTVSWGTDLGGWRSGLNHVNITAISGVFFNSTVYTFTIIAPNATLVLSATMYSATYGDSIPIGFTFMNLTLGAHPFASLITLYMNGTSVTPTDLGGGSYAYVLGTRYFFPQAGLYHVNFTAQCGTYYTATNITVVALSKIPMSLSIQTPQTSVTIGSSLSVSANLVYGNGTSAPDGFAVQFNFIVTYTNGSVITISKAAVINIGVASSSLLATSDMKSVSVNATYAGNGITTSASDLKQDIQVVAPQGLSLMTIALIGGGGGALVVALVGILKYRGRRKRTEVTKTKALVQTASLAQLIVVHLASGRALYSRSIGSEEGADPNLISGFLSANQSIITEVFKKQPGAGLKFADYGEYKVVSNVGNYVMATLFCTETAGEELQGILRSFTEKFEKKYASVLQSWDGNMSAFKDADNIADDVFSLPLCSPYMLLDTQISKLSRDERAAVHSARILSGERGVFFMPRVVDFLLTKQNLKRGKAMDVINSLMKKGVFRQLTIEQAAQVVKSTTEQAGNQA